MKSGHGCNMTPPEERRNSAARRSRGMLDQAEVVAGRVVEVGRHRRDHLDRLQFLVGEQYLQGGQARRWRAGRPDAVNRGTPSCGDATSREVARLPPFLAEEKLRRSVPTSGEGLSRNLISLHVGWSTHWSTGWSPRHAVGASRCTSASLLMQALSASCISMRSHGQDF